jgi:hypothetical protein
VTRAAVQAWARLRCRLAVVLTGAALLLVFAGPALAATIGVGEGLRMHVQLHDVEAERRPPLEELSRQALTDVQDRLHTKLSGDLYIDYVGSPRAFDQVMAQYGVKGWSEAWISGMALLERDRVIVQVNGPGALLTSEVVRHEIAHVTVHALSQGRWLPRWYHEGVSMWLAGEVTWERLREMSGAAAFGELDHLQALDDGFTGNQIGVQRAYATAAGFVRFAVHRNQDPASLARLHQRMREGVDFAEAFRTTFGLPPESLFAIYAAQVGQTASKWAVLATDTALWVLVSLLAALGMLAAFRSRARLLQPDPEDDPLDLEAIAAAGEAAMARPWRRPGFDQERLRVEDGDEDDDGLAKDWADRPVRPWKARDFLAFPLEGPEPPDNVYDDSDHDPDDDGPLESNDSTAEDGEATDRHEMNSTSSTNSAAG